MHFIFVENSRDPKELLERLCSREKAGRTVIAKKTDLKTVIFRLKNVRYGTKNGDSKNRLQNEAHQGLTKKKPHLF